MALGPVIGAYADARAAKKRVLVVATIGCISATAGLYFAREGDIAIAVICVIVSNFCYAIGENIAAAFLPELARPDALGKVSGWGWSLGYVGGLVALGLCLAWIMSAESRGMTTTDAVPMTSFITAGVYLFGALITFIWLKERAVAARTADTMGAWQRLMATAREARRYRDLQAMFITGALYQAGVATIITLAAIYAQEVMGFTTKDTLLLVLVVNVTACIGAFGFGYVQDAIGKKRALMLSLFLWVAMVFFAWFAVTPTLFWVSANLAGIAMGSSQSAGRAMVAYFSPANRAGEFFGLWGVATRFAAVMGPLTYGAISWASGGNHRLAMLITGVFFVAAIAALTRVDEARGRAAAEATE
jgi:UMF1 family MFS transporter